MKTVTIIGSRTNIVYLIMSCMWFESVIGNIENLIFCFRWIRVKERNMNVFGRLTPVAIDSIFLLTILYTFLN